MLPKHLLSLRNWALRFTHVLRFLVDYCRFFEVFELYFLVVNPPVG